MTHASRVLLQVRRNGAVSYDPVNIIPEEVSALLQHEKPPPFDSALLPFSQDTFEPARLLNDLRLESASTEDFGDLYQDGLLHFQARHS